MAHTQATAKVGAVVILAMALMGGVVYFFVGRGTGGYPVDVSFHDAQGIKQQAEVRLAGVKIGAVKDIAVDPTGRRAILHLRINPKQNIPEHSVYTITSGGLLGEYFVQITPPRVQQAAETYVRKTGSPPPFIVGTDLPTFDELKVQVAQLGKGSQDIVKNLKAATANVARLTNDPALQASLRGTIANVNTLSRQATLTTLRLNRIIDTEVPVLRATLDNVQLTSRNIGAATQNVPQAVANTNRLLKSTRTLVEGLETSNTFLRETISDTLQQVNPGPSLRTTLENMAAASEQFKQIAADARKISDDLATQTSPGANTRLGAVVTNVGQVAEKASTLLDKLTGVAGKAGKKRGRLINGSPQVDVYQRLNGTNPFRADVNLAIPRGEKSAIILGLRDIGESNQLNFQNSTVVAPRLKVRYGFYASKLGVGADYSLQKPPAPGVIMNPLGTNSISLDFYDPNRRYLDLYARHQINDKMGIAFGVEDIFHETRPTIGFTYRP